MGEFEYLAALVSVVAGSSLTRALSGYAKIFDSDIPHIFRLFLAGNHGNVECDDFGLAIVGSLGER